MGKSISKTWSEDQAERISYPRIWHDNWKTVVLGQGSLRDVEDGAQHWQRRRWENWASCSSFRSKNILHFSLQVSRERI